LVPRFAIKKAKHGKTYVYIIANRKRWVHRCQCLLEDASSEEEEWGEEKESNSVEANVPEVVDQRHRVIAQLRSDGHQSQCIANYCAMAWSTL